MSSERPDKRSDALGPYDQPSAREAAQRLGMFVFLSSETLLFAGLFALYAGYRAEYPAAFAGGVQHNEEWIGSVNTLILLASSLCAALADQRLRRARRRSAQLLVLATLLLGSAFLALKGLEYVHHWHKGIRPGGAYHFPDLDVAGASLFFTLYYGMTALHALHVAGGVCALAWIALLLQRRSSADACGMKLELTALYWHMVDIVWIFLWPLLYLIH